MRYDETQYVLDAIRENYEKGYHKGLKDGITSTMAMIASISICAVGYYEVLKLIQKHKENKSKNDE